MDLNDLLEKASALQANMQDDKVYEGSQGGKEGVIAKVTSSMELVDLEINDELLQDKDMLKDMLIIAVNDAIKKATEAQASKMEDYMKNLGF